MDAMKAAFERAGFDEFEKQKSHEAKNRWLLKNGLRSVLPIKQVHLHLGLTRTKGGMLVLNECYVTRRAG
jgi:hypothetical protein